MFPEPLDDLLDRPTSPELPQLLKNPRQNIQYSIHILAGIIFAKGNAETAVRQFNRKMHGK